MGYASRAGRAYANASNPRAFGVCMRCGLWDFRERLSNQNDWRGAALTPLYIFVCRPCLDIPQEQLRSITIPADPVPIQFALTEPFLEDETNFRTVNQPLVIDPTTGIPVPSTTQLVNQDGVHITLQPIGKPEGMDPNAIMPNEGVMHYAVPLTPLSVAADALLNVNVVCAANHGLLDDDQISVQGLSNHSAEGFYSVTVQSPVAFSYLLVNPVKVGSLMTSATKILTAKVGLPLGYAQIPNL